MAAAAPNTDIHGNLVMLINQDFKGKYSYQQNDSATVAFNPKVTLHFVKFIIFIKYTKYHYRLNKFNDPFGLDENDASFSLTLFGQN